MLLIGWCACSGGPGFAARGQASRAHNSITPACSGNLTNKWGLGPLGARTAAANSIGVAITETQPRTDTLSVHSHLDHGCTAAAAGPGNRK